MPILPSPLNTASSSEDFSFFTDGTFVCRFQGAIAIQQYLATLTDRLKNEKLTSKQLIRILTQQNTDGWSVGMIIARHQDATTTQQYLQLLKDALENGKLTSEQLTMLLTQQNKDGWSVGRSIACNQDATTTQQYLQLLKDALENGKLTSEQLTMILTQKNTDGWSVGMFIARHQDATTTQQYLQLLKDALENGKLTSEQLTMLLTQQDKDGWSVGMFIARHQDATTTQQYLQLLKDALENGKLTSEQLTMLLTQKNTDGWSVGMFIAFNQDKATQQQYQDLKKITSFLEKIKGIFTLLEPLEFDKAIEKLKNLLLTKDGELTDSHKSYLNEKVKNLIAALNIKTSYRRKEKESFEFLRTLPSNSLFYTATLIAQLEFETLDTATLDSISSKLDKLPKTHFDYTKGQLALTNYYVKFLEIATPSELLQLLIHAERCSPLHAILDEGYDRLGNFFHTENNDNIKIILKKLVLLVSDNPFALKRLEGILNFNNEDALLDFYLERILFHSSETEKSSKNISNFFKLVTLPLHPTNKFRKIQITPEKCQELENLVSSNKPSKKSVATLIDEFNKGNITEENLFTELRNSIKKTSSDYLKAACNEHCSLQSH